MKNFQKSRIGLSLIHSLNVAKTKFMVFSMPQKKINIPLLRLANSNIDNFNFLGITVDKHLSWTAHTEKVTCKIARVTGVLNKLKQILPRYSLKSIYISLIQCHINYGILTWGHNNSRISKLQKRAIRIIRVRWGKAPPLRVDPSLTYLIISTSKKSYTYVTHYI